MSVGVLSHCFSDLKQMGNETVISWLLVEQPNHCPFEVEAFGLGQQYTVKLTYNEHGYCEFTFITKFF